MPIQFEELRKQLDKRFTVIHDELTRCYYEGQPFRSYGVLTKEQFDALHGLLYHKYEQEFHTRNQKRQQPYPEAKYNYIDVTDLTEAGITAEYGSVLSYNIDGRVVVKKHEAATAKVASRKLEGIELEI